MTKVRAAWRRDAPRFGPMNGYFMVRRSERLAAEVILPLEGFTEIADVAGSKEPYDLLAIKGGERYAIDVTLAPFKYGRPNGVSKLALDWLMRQCGLRRLVLFVSPDFTRYVLKDMRGAFQYATLTLELIRKAKPIPARTGE